MSSDEQDELGNRGVTASVSKQALRKKPTQDNSNDQEHKFALSKEASYVILSELETWERKRHTLRDRKKKTPMSCTSAISSVYSAWRHCQDEDEYKKLRKRYEGDVFNNLKAFIDAKYHHSTKAKNIHNSIKTHCNPTSILGYVSKKKKSLHEWRPEQVKILKKECERVWYDARPSSLQVNKISSCLGVMNRNLKEKKEQSAEDLIIGAFLQGSGARMEQASHLLNLCARNGLYFSW